MEPIFLGKKCITPHATVAYFKKACPTFCCSLNSDFVFCDRFNFQECGQANYYNLVGCCSYGCI